MSVLHTLIQNDSTDEALNYIRKNTESYNNTAITRYCGNDMINSVISVYKIRFTDKNLHLNCDIKINDIVFSETEFCAILSNALENSMHAIEGLAENKHWAKLSISNRGNSILMQLENPTDKTPRFVDGIPVSDKKGHGIGIKSIIYYVDKLNGQWQFTVNDGKFIMQVII
jgi:sensor histidine kinase regulating citrate/malate metabolism